MRVCWVVEGMLMPGSAYHEQIMLFSNYLHDYGVDSSIANVPSFEETDDLIITAVQNYDADVIVTFGDVQPYALGEYLDTPLISWFLWGSTNPIPDDLNQFKMATFAAVSPKVYHQLEEAGIPCAYIPHGFDPTHFRPGPRDIARERIGWDHDKPVVLVVGTNLPQPDREVGPDRKNWRGTLQSFADISSDAILYCHTTNEGWENIRELAEEFGIADKVQVADQEQVRQHKRDYDAEYMANLYRASDVFLMPSFAEGFGVPLIEAQACGIPVVTTGSVPMSELVKTGISVAWYPHPEREDWAAPNQEQLTDALDFWLTYDNNEPDEWRWEIASKVRQYSADYITGKYFFPALEQAAATVPQRRFKERDELEQGDIRLDIGSGGPMYERKDRAWITVDKYQPAHLQADMWDLPYEDGSVIEIWSAHALEHVPRERVIPTLKEWYRVLKEGGTATVLVPDLDYICEFWLKEGAGAIPFVFGNQEHEGEFHKTGWNLESFKADFEEAGFEVRSSESLWTKDYNQKSLKIVVARA